MEEKKLQKQQEINGKAVGQDNTGAVEKPESVSETWAEETIADLDDFIESQGIYIRQ